MNVREKEKQEIINAGYQWAIDVAGQCARTVRSSLSEEQFEGLQEVIRDLIIHHYESGELQTKMKTIDAVVGIVEKYRPHLFVDEIIQRIQALKSGKLP
jgi:hypothetical protein